MSNLLTYTDCKDLCHTICQSFYHGRENEFEVWRNNKVPTNKNSVMYFYDNQITAFICFNALKKKYKASLLWREYNYTIGKSKKLHWSEEWIIVVNDEKEFKKFN